VMGARTLPEWYPTLGLTHSDGRARHVRLRPLPMSEAELFLDRWSSRNEVSLEDGEVRSFVGAASGNPFYLGELAAHRARGGKDGEPPATIRRLIELQFLSLSESAQQVLLTIGLLGEHATLERTALVLGLSTGHYAGALNELDSSGLLASRGATMRLKHDLITEIVHSLVTPSVLSLLRFEAACCLEGAMPADQLDVDLLHTVVALWDALGESDRSILACMRLGDALLLRGLARDAAAAYDRVARNANTPVLRARAQLGRIRSLSQQMHWADIIATVFEPRCDMPDEAAAHLRISVAEARYWLRGELPSGHFLGSLVADGQQEFSLRARAARIICTVWDNSDGSWPLPCSIIELERVAETWASLDAWMASLILATSSGDAARVHKLIVRRDDSSEPNAALRVRSLRLSGHALMRLGEAAASLDLLTQALGSAIDLDLRWHQALTVSMIARASAHLVAVDALQDALHQSGKLYLDTPSDPMIRRTHAFVSSCAAWVGNTAVSHHQVDDSLCLLEPEDFKADPTSSYAALVLASALKPGRNDSDLLTWIHEQSGFLLSRGSSDQFAIASALLLLRAASTRNTIDFLERYLVEQRTEKTPMHAQHLVLLPPDLRVAVSKLAPRT
jgi:hypothetical protein